MPAGTYSYVKNLLALVNAVRCMFSIIQYWRAPSALRGQIGKSCIRWPAWAYLCLFYAAVAGGGCGLIRCNDLSVYRYGLERVLSSVPTELFLLLSDIRVRGGGYRGIGRINLYSERDLSKYWACCSSTKQFLLFFCC